MDNVRALHGASLSIRSVGVPLIHISPFNHIARQLHEELSAQLSHGDGVKTKVRSCRGKSRATAPENCVSYSVMLILGKVSRVCYSMFDE